jgi:hypothetical protein
MMNILPGIGARIITILLAAGFAAAATAAEMPRLQFAIGDVYAIGVDGKQRPMKKGDALRPGEKLLTGKKGMAQLRIFKQGVVALRDNSALELKPSAGGNYAVTLDKGLMRTVTRLGYQLGRIDVVAPGVDIDVDSGDVLTGVGVFGQEDTTTLYRVLDGDIKVKSGSRETLAQVGRVVKVDSRVKDGGIRNVSPDVMRLTVPVAGRVNTGNSGGAAAGSNSRSGMVIGGSDGRILTNAFASDQAKIAVLKPGAAANEVLAVVRPEITVPVEKPRLEPPITTNYDGVKVFDPRTTLGSVDDQASVNNALIIKIPSNISRTASFIPISPTDPSIRAVLDTKAQIVNLSPSASVAGATTLSAPLCPRSGS